MAGIKLDTGVKTFEFTDLNDHVFARFSVNPTDINLAVRASEASELMSSFGNAETMEQAVDMNRELEDKIAHVLGVDRNSVFGEISAMTIFPDGSMWAQIILDKIIETVEPALEDRKKKMVTAQERYLAKYENHGESV